MTSLNPQRYGFILAVCWLLFTYIPAPAQTWIQTATGTYAWNIDANWDSIFPNSATATANLTNSVAGTQTLTLNQAITVNQLILGLTGNANPFVINTGSSGTLTFDGTTPALSVVTGSTAAHAINAPVTLAAGVQINHAGTATFTISGAISGSAGLTNIGTGTVALSGQNTFTGGVILNAGTLNIVNDTQQAAGTVTLNSSTNTLRNPLGHDGTTAGPITLGGGTLNLRYRGDNGTGSQTIIFGNAVSVSAGASTTINVNRPTGGDQNKVAAMGALALGAGSTLNVSGGNGYSMRFEGMTIDGTASINNSVSVNMNSQPTSGTNTPILNKVGGSDILLGTPGTASGITQFNVNGGRLFFANQNAIGAATLAVGSGAILTYNGTTNFSLSNPTTVTSGGGIATRTNTLTINPNILPTTGSVVFNNDDQSTTTVTIDGNYESLTGNLTIQLSGGRFLSNNQGRTIGQVVINGGFQLGGMDRTIDVNMAANSANNTIGGTPNLLVNGATTLNGNLTLNTGNTGLASLPGAVVSFLGSIDETGGSRSLTKGDIGTLNLLVPNTYTGTTTLNGGLTRFGVPQALGGTGATLNIGTGAVATTSFTLNQSFVNRIVPSSAGVLALGTDDTGALNLSGFGGLRLGAFANRVYTGALTPDSTTYRFGGAGFLTVSSNLSDNAGATLVDVQSLAAGASQVMLTGNNTFSGGTAISNNGILIVPNDAALGAAIGGITLNNGRLAITGSFSSARAVTLDAGGGRIDTNGFNLSLTGNITGSGGLTKSGDGVLTLSGTNSFTAANSITAGSIRMTQPSGTPLGTGSTGLLGGILAYAPTGSGTAAATIGTAASNFTYTAGTVAIDAGSNTTASLTLGGTGGLVRGTRGSMTIAPAGGITALGVTERVFVGGTPPVVTNGIVTPSIVGRNTDGSGDFLTYGPNGFTRTTAYTGTFGAMNIVELTAATSLTASANPAFALKVGGGDLTLDSSSNAVTVTIGPATGQSGLILNNVNILGTGANARTLQFTNGAQPHIYVNGSANIQVPVAGNQGLNVIGPGTLRLNTDNTFTGAELVVDEATLLFNGAGNTTANTDPTSLGATGARNIRLRNGGTMAIDGFSWNPNSGTKTLTIDPSGGRVDVASTLTLSLDDPGQFTVNGPFVKTGLGALSLSFAGGTIHTVNAPVIVSAGTLRTSSGGLGIGVSFDSPVIVNGGSLDTTGIINKLVYLQGTNAIINSSTATGGVAGPVILTADASVASANPIALQGPVSGAFTLTKGGSGTLTLGGGVGDAAANTFSNLTVSNGTVLLNKNEGTNAVGGDVLINGGILSVARPNQIPDTATVTISGGSFQNNTGPLPLNETIAALNVSGGQVNSGSNNASPFIVTGTVTQTGGLININSSGAMEFNALNISGPSGNAVQLSANSTTRTSLRIGPGGLTFSNTTGTPVILLNNGTTLIGGEIRLNGNVTKTGATQANISVGTAFAADPARIDLNGATRTFTVTDAAGLLLVTPRITDTTGAPNTGIIKLGPGALVLGGTNFVASNYGGMTEVREGLLRNSVTAGPNMLPVTTTLILGDGATNTSGRYGLQGQNQTVAGLMRLGSGTNNRVINDSTTAATFTVNYNGSMQQTYTGILGGTTANENNFSFTKTGSGTFILTGNNTYTGATTVAAGRLLVNSQTSPNSGTGTGNVSVSSGATFGGTGRSAGNVTLAAGAILAPGNGLGTGTFTVNNTVTLNGDAPGTGAMLSFGATRTAVDTATADQVNVTGTGRLNFANLAVGVPTAGDNKFILNVVSDALNPLLLNETYTVTLATTPGVQRNGLGLTGPYTFDSNDYQLISPDFIEFTNVSLVVTAANVLQLTFTPLTPVPEPSLILPLLLAGGWLARRRFGRG